MPKIESLPACSLLLAGDILVLRWRKPTHKSYLHWWETHMEWWAYECSEVVVAVIGELFFQYGFIPPTFSGQTWPLTSVVQSCISKSRLDGRRGRNNISAKLSRTACSVINHSGAVENLPAAHRTSVSIRRWKKARLAELVAWKATNSKEGSMNSQATPKEDLSPTLGQARKEVISLKFMISETRQDQMGRIDSGNRNCWLREPLHLRR